MTLKHKRCGGAVFKDDVVPTFDFIDLSCLMCGYRWFVEPESKLGVLLNGEGST